MRGTPVLLLIGLSLPVALGAAPLCREVFSAPLASPLDELADLTLEARNETDFRRKNELLTLVRAKLAELEAHVGAGVREQLRLRLEERMARPEEKDANLEIEAKRTRQRESFQLVREVVREKMGNISELSEHYIDALSGTSMPQRNMKGEGVQWTRDERFVLMRDDPKNNPQKARLFDIVENRFLDLNVIDGILPSDGAYWIQVVGGKTKITVLPDANRTLEFNGHPMGVRYATTNYLITVIKKPTYVGAYYVYNDVQTGRSLELGPYFALSNDGKTVYRRKEGLFEAVDIATGHVKDSFSGSNNNKYGMDTGFFLFKRKDKEYLVRLTDGAQFEVPKNYTPIKISPDGTKILYYVDLRNNGWKIIDLATGQEIHSFHGWGLDDAVSPERPLGEGSRYVLFSGYGAKEPRLLDWNTLSLTPLREGYRYLSPNGRWAYHNGKSNLPARVFDTQTNQEMTLEINSYVHFLGETGLFLWTSGSRTMLGDARNMNANVAYIGEGEGQSSPLGHYAVALRDGELVILEVSP